MPEPLANGPVGPSSNAAGLPFIELQSVDSTNNYARQLITEGLAQDGMTIFAHEQTAGRGQRGHSWTSEKSANIMMSLLLEAPPLALTDQFQLSAVVSLAIHEFFSKYAGDSTRIKWPNDLYWQDRKAGGVLIESVIAGSSGVRSPESGVGSQESTWRWAIVGIGININQVSFPPVLKNPVSLKQITGKHFNTIELAKELNVSIQKWYDELLQNGFDNILDLYNRHLYKKDEMVKLKKENIVFEAIIKSISPTGKLIIQHAFEEELGFGDLEWIL